MSTQHIISTIVSVCFAMLLVHYIKAPRAQAPSQENGKTVLRAGKIYTYVPLVGILFSCFFAIIGIIFNSKSGADAFGWLALPGFFLLLGIPLFIISKKRIIFDQNVIEQKTFFGGTVALSWSAVKKVAGRVVNKDVLLTDGGEKKITVDIQMIGFNKFLELLKQKIASAEYAEIEVAVARMYRK